MLKQRPTLDITRSNRSQFCAQVDKNTSHIIQSAKLNIPELYDLHCFESNAERLDFIDSLLADITYPFSVAERVEGSVHSPDSTLRVSNTAKEWPATTSHTGRSNPAVYLHPILSSGKSPW